jgi:hypothetical protein
VIRCYCSIHGYEALLIWRRKGFFVSSYVTRVWTSYRKHVRVRRNQKVTNITAVQMELDNGSLISLESLQYPSVLLRINEKRVIFCFKLYNPHLKFISSTVQKSCPLEKP